MKRIFICLVDGVGLATAVTLKASQKRSKLNNNIKADIYWKPPSPIMKLVSTAKHQRLWL